ncbi:MAG: carotenoid 1,2-hydratase [Pseudomonadota bacterium]
MAFIGSVFSPWYRWSGRRNPANHCCLNVATYGQGGRWTMTDRGEDALVLEQNGIHIGPSSMRWENDSLVVDIDERSWPHLNRLKGRVVIHPEALTSVELPLTEAGTHIWRPFAPDSRIEVSLNRPGWTFSGHGYFDANFGTRALEDDFSYWTWGRYPTRSGAVTFYDAARRDGTDLGVAVSFEQGAARVVEAPPQTRFRRSLWTVRRETRADPGTTPRQVKAMLDAPFYCRAAVETTIHGERTTGVHEALDLDRFASPLLKPMLAVKVPRRRGWAPRP